MAGGKFHAQANAKARKIRVVTPLPKRPRARDHLKQPKKKMNAARDIVLEVCGFAPYERRIMELLKVGREKRALRFAKRRLGTHKAAKRKREKLSDIIRQQKQPKK
eukprot:NODE_7371_length_444_cov_30.987382_g7205_i0.p1 GENE.NODE_7371_length_444_cov_30.987382_g7205_i0~~NODE_7371_length_444_cov_30.987382_g7205_i0.p1  ORF type:complete len:124 (+),score=29.43 NODE_7371_length_444_cov_30.987382_g7205_i0:55-372(+)